ncbi:MAG: hypothetical protein AMXMBFR74_33110 [Parvibaculum sp.]
MRPVEREAGDAVRVLAEEEGGGFFDGLAHGGVSRFWFVREHSGAGRESQVLGEGSGMG